MQLGKSRNRYTTCRRSRNGKCKLETSCCSYHEGDKSSPLSAYIVQMISQRCDGKHSCSLQNPVLDSFMPVDPEYISYLSVEFNCITGNYAQKFQNMKLCILRLI